MCILCQNNFIRRNYGSNINNLLIEILGVQLCKDPPFSTFVPHEAGSRFLLRHAQVCRTFLIIQLRSPMLAYLCSQLRKPESLRKSVDKLRRRRIRLSMANTLRRYYCALPHLSLMQACIIYLLSSLFLLELKFASFFLTLTMLVGSVQNIGQ